MWISLVCSVLLVPVSAQQDPPPLTKPPWTEPKDGWDIGTDVYPNPQTDPGRCKQTERSWLCDPNSMLSSGDERDDGTGKVLTKLNELHMTSPVCDCQHGCVAAGVAVVNKLKLLNAGELEATMMQYADEILRQWDYVNVQCSNSYLVFMTWQQNQTYVATRVNVNKMTAECDRQLNITRHQCVMDRTDCILNLLDIYKSLVLNETCHDVNSNNGDNGGSGGSYAIAIIIGVVLGVVILAAAGFTVWLKVFKAKTQPPATQHRQTTEAAPLKASPASDGAGGNEQKV